MPFENNNDIDIKVTLDAEQAQQNLKQLSNETKKFKDEAEDAEDSTNLLASAIKALGVTVSVQAIKAFLALGDSLGNVEAAFDEATKKAGALSDELLSNLAAATKNTISNLDLMSAASRALELGIAADQLDDIAFAAQRFADATQGDVLQSFQQLTSAIKTGNVRLLDLYGDLRDGELILKAFGQAEADAFKSAVSLNDSIDRFLTTISNTTAAIAKAVNECRFLVTAFNTLVSIGEAVYEVLASIGSIIGKVVGPVFRVLYDAVTDVVQALGTLAEIMAALARGDVRSFKDVSDIIAKNSLPAISKAAEEAGNTFIKFGKNADDSAKKLAETLKKLKDVQDDFTVSLNDVFGQESFVLIDDGKFVDTLRNAIRKAFKSGDVLSELKKVSQVFTEGIVDPEELQKRFNIFLKEVRIVQPEFEQDAPGSFADVIAGGLQDTFSGLSDELAGTISDSLVSAFDTAFGLLETALSGGQINIGAIASSLSTTIGTIIGSTFESAGAPFIGAAAGGFVGTIISGITSAFESEDGAGTKARKSADKFFADVFDANRLAIVVGDQLKQVADLVFSGDTAFGGTSDFASGTFDDFLTTLPANVQAGLKGVGAAFEELLGIGEDVAGQLAAVIANNIGGELNNLQLLVEATGESFENLHDAVVEAFLDGKLTIEEAQIALEGLQQVAEAGIPGAIGAIDQAFRNLQVSVASGKGSRALADAIRDIGIEAQELGLKELPALANRLTQVFGFSAQQVAQFFEAMKASGINSLNELANASTETAIAIATNMQRLERGEAPTATPVNQASENSPVSNFTGRTGGSNTKSKAELEKERRDREKKNERQKLINDTLKLVQASEQFKNITESLTKGLISEANASQRLNALYDEAFRLNEQLRTAQAKFEADLRKGTATADQLKKLNALKTSLEELTKAAKKTTDTINLDGLAQFADNLNLIGIAAKELGINLDDVQKSIVDTFKAGKASAAEANAELNKAKDILTAGIPGAVGATEEAFRNLLRGGSKGGAFSLDAFKDIFAEAEEQFLQKLSPARSQQFQQITRDVDTFKTLLQDALNSGPAAGESRSDFDARVASLKDRLEGAKKALSDFYETVPKIGFEDLRSILLESFDAETVRKFFDALSGSGINSFDQLANATDTTIIGILSRLGELGLPFQETSDEITRLNEEIASLTQDREANLKFNISTSFADGESRAVFDLVFGGDGGINYSIGAETPGTGGGTDADFTRLQELKRIRASRKLNKNERKEFDILRRKFR